ncbi:MAG: phospholipase D-like domain-containing protein [Nonlabens sp.]
MPQFLNTQLFYHAILEMINDCDHELVIIVPYIKMTNEIFEALQKANSRGVETTLVYREKKVHQSELDRLNELDNINILHHPNVHCKMYYDGKQVIIGSLNLYDYSIANNREMGVLSNIWDFDDEDNEVMTSQNLRDEIQQIFNGSIFEKKSSDTVRDGFKIDIVKSREQLVREYCVLLNQHFLNKQFEPKHIEELGIVATCIGYRDKVTVCIDTQRAAIIFNKKIDYDSKLVKSLGKGFSRNKEKLNLSKYDWRIHRKILMLYNKDLTYRELDRMNHVDTPEVWKQRIDEVLSLLK